MYINVETLSYGVVGAGLGLYWFLSGFRQLKSSRTIQNIPTSRIATGAVGANVEIKGKILRPNGQLLSGPISGRSCSFFSIEIQKLVRTKNSRRWVRVDQFYSDEHFFVDDGSGALAQVFVKGAVIQRKGANDTFRSRSSNFGSMPQGLRAALQRQSRFNLNPASWFFSREYRFIEWRFEPQETVYVLGYADSGLKIRNRPKLKFAHFLAGKKQIEADPKLQERFDTNQDGMLDESEMERGAQLIGLKLQETATPAVAEAAPLQAKMVFRRRKPHAYFISNMKEEDLVKKLSWKATLKLWGGPVVAIGSAAYLFWFLMLGKDL